MLVRAGTVRPDATPPLDATPAEDRPWLAGMERLDDPRLARRFVTSRLLYRRLRRYLWAPPLVLAAVALLLRVEFVVDGLGRVFRSPRQQSALQHAYDASWFSRFIVTVVIAVAAARRAGRRGRPHVPRHLAGARRRAASPRRGPGASSGERPIAHALLEVDGQDALDADPRRRRGRARRASSSAGRSCPS